MRILIVSYYYWPALTPRAFRWEAIARTWAERGHTVDVVTSAIPGTAACEQQGGVTVQRTGSVWGGRLRSCLRGEPRNQLPADTRGLQAQRAAPLDRCRKLVRSTYDTTWKQAAWPDFACLWYFSAVACARRLARQHAYDTLLSVSLPFTGHLVGLRLKKCFPRLRWLVDIGDPFCWGENQRSLNNARLYGRLNVAAERKVFEFADQITVTNRRTGDRYGDLFGPSAKRKTAVIGPLIAPRVLEASVSRDTFPLPQQRVNVVFTGALVSSVRRPRELLVWMERVARAWEKTNAVKLLFHLIGSVGDFHSLAREAGISTEYVQCHGLLPQDRALAALHASDFVLNCGNTTDYQLPSKVYEYMATGKPIINVVFNPRDPAIDALNEYPQVVHCDAERVPSAELMSFLLKHVAQPQPAVQEQIPLVREHLVASIASKYEELLCAAANTSRPRELSEVPIP